MKRNGRWSPLERAVVLFWQQNPGGTDQQFIDKHPGYSINSVKGIRCQMIREGFLPTTCRVNHTPSPLIDQVLEYSLKNPDASRNEVAKALGISPHTVRNYRIRLAEQGKLEKRERGWWPNQGKRDKNADRRQHEAEQDIQGGGVGIDDFGS